MTVCPKSRPRAIKKTQPPEITARTEGHGPLPPPILCYLPAVTNSPASDLDRRLESLSSHGVRLVDPRQVFVAHDVDLDRVHPGAVLHPGTRLQGARTWIGPHAQIGTEGPATVIDAVFDEGASIASGFVQGAVLLRKASLGANTHVRPGTLLEEEASTAHAVGLKQTILLSFVTLGSLINFCDCLMAGGTSRKDHSEVGSGYIHFNFTPWGERGDKATPSLIGCVPRGVFLRERRIFLGGTGGLVGPADVGYGAVAGAGQVVRKGIAAGRLVLSASRAVDRPIDMHQVDPIQPRANKNVHYIGQLFALRAWYRQVRLPTTPSARRPVIEAALQTLDSCIDERVKQLDRFLAERGGKTPTFALREERPCPIAIDGEIDDHVTWVRGLTDEQVAEGTTWLEAIVGAVTRGPLEQLRPGQTTP